MLWNPDPRATSKPGYLCSMKVQIIFSGYILNKNSNKKDIVKLFLKI